MAKILRTASGMRHLDWGRDVFASMNAHIEINYTLSELQQQRLVAERDVLGALLLSLESAVFPYRAWLDGADTQIRAKQRVGKYLCGAALSHAEAAARPLKKDLDHAVPGFWGRFLSAHSISELRHLGRESIVRACEAAASTLRSVPAFLGTFGAAADARDKAAGVLDLLNVSYRDDLTPQREPLKAAVLKAVSELHEGLEQMDGRLRSYFPQAFIDSLYPELDTKGRTVDQTNGADAGTP